MKIGFDASALLLPITGLGRYTQQIIKYLEKIKKPKDEIIYFWGPKYSETDFIRDDIVKSKHTHRSSFRGLQSLWEQFVLPMKIKKYNFDIYHSPRNKNIPYMNIKSTSILITLHDTLPFLYSSETFYYKIVKWRWKRAVKVADKIITVSKNSKKDILQQFSFLNESDVIINYCGVDDKFLINNIEMKRLDDVKRKYGIKKPYLLASGSTEPVKNNKMLIKVMEIGQNKYPEIFKNIELVIAGPLWPGSKIEKNLPENIKFTGYIEDEDFPVLMGGADIFLFPSLYEGFGLPPLEAMAAKTMVLSSNTSSLPEIIGEAANMIDPRKPELWVDNIYSILESDKKKKILKKGFKRVKKFSWLKTAEKLYTIYENEYKKNKKR